MYDIDFSTAKPVDIIRRSLVCHPSLFSESLLNQIEAHNQFLAECRPFESQKGAKRAKEACERALAISDITQIEHVDFDLLVVAFSTAARLQSIPYATRKDIMERYQ